MKAAGFARVTPHILIMRHSELTALALSWYAH
jgi:hypothetical protein